MKFCCKNFVPKKDGHQVVYYSSELDDAIEVIEYNRKTRRYFITLNKKWSYDISYCPWCGKKLPKPLMKKWFAVLKKECGLADPQGSDHKKVPKEFETDEWWKKRGL